MTLAEGIASNGLELIGRLEGASNAAFLCRVSGTDTRAIYKPTAGERPLWDFPPDTLGHREVAAYVVSTGLGWNIVPETMWLGDGPLGAGSCQLWVEDAQPTLAGISRRVPEGALTIGTGTDDEGVPVALWHSAAHAVQRIALFDAIVNNADRKAGHLLSAPDGSAWAIDHGVCFSADPKLRTVLWGWADEAVPARLLHDAHMALSTWSTWSTRLAELLHENEVIAVSARLEAIVEKGTFPVPSATWPALPWPLF